ncbi:Predicted phosphohydrolase or phosphomutase, AlkP superfamily [Halogranum amylolyticum]|uniref:Predicted phosphohydrolase or phosphomutase, AlkP superfamily n=1 Tax=Halogranum amylolyticum TaxID=660520 RepID=A0A1H8PJ13_9EURY|nr:alkaline phosphatase family protein [Halogranum amylolyticum]SEO42009.1 Predicted phosphohydrolase or phosphomutase, AlkP superfamily [Halogranum amylolyticum]
MGLFDRLRGNDNPRVAFIGIDGVPFSLLDEHRDEFPNFAALAEEGSAGAIDSIVPPESSACWPALTTGVNPGETGVYGFQDREVGSYDTYVPMGRDVQAKRLWDRVGEAGMNATVMNVPVTFPPQRNVQRMVSGFLSPGVDKAAYPDEFRDYLQEIDYKIDVNAKLGHKDDKSDFVEDAHDTLDKRFEAFEHYIQEDDWDLFFGVFMTTDRVNHFLFKDYERDGENKEAFMEFYRKVDEYVGKIRDMLPEDVTLVVASDHGFTSLDYEVHFNTWLEQEGWLSYESDDHSELGDIADETDAYSLIPGRFYLNLEGREPRGSVAEDDYEAKRAELKEALENLEGPDGNKVAARVVEKEEAFRGEHDDIAPDLVVIPNHGFDLKAGFKGHDDVFGTGPRNGMHSFDNASLYVDDPEASIEDADLFDIAPTVLDLMEVEYQRSEFDGGCLLSR